MTPAHGTEPPFALRSRNIHFQPRFRHGLSHGGGGGRGDAEARSIRGTGDASTHGAVAEDGVVGQWGDGEGKVEEGAVAAGEDGGGHFGSGSGDAQPETRLGGS